ncbi:MAG TPA: hypothetical protein VK662_09515 [Acidothermaceae bacterium]|nr:hypothetical protein [Acidothermaceae bacterium]
MSTGGRGHIVTVAAAAWVVVLGAVAGFIGLLEATAIVRLGIVHVSVGAVISGVANFSIGLFAVWGIGSRDAAALPAIGWFAVLLLAIFGPHPGGDIVIPGSGWDVGVFVVVGALGPVLAALLAGRVVPVPTPSPPPDR